MVKSDPRDDDLPKPRKFHIHLANPTPQSGSRVLPRSPFGDEDSHKPFRPDSDTFEPTPASIELANPRAHESLAELRQPLSSSERGHACRSDRTPGVDEKIWVTRGAFVPLADTKRAILCHGPCGQVGPAG
jgi:hypothetical protein